jgi:perosamine synthetase
VSPEEPIPLARPDLGRREEDLVLEVMRSGRLSLGPVLERFEREFAGWLGTADAVAVSSGTAALHLAVLALGLEPGDEVLVPAYTFPATANVVALAGLKPVLVDVDPETMNVDPSRIEVGPRTKAVMAVHLFGRPAPIEELPDLPLIEDAAGALGARRRGRACGSLGVMGCLSFHPRKIVTTGEGGAITTSDARIADASRRLRNHGWQSLADADMPEPGLNYRLSDVLCAVGLPQLRRLEELLAARTRVAAAYAERLAGLHVGLPAAEEGDVHGWQAYVIRVERRDVLLAMLRAEGVEAQIGTFAVNRLAPYRDQGSFPGADRAFEQALALPFHTGLTEPELDRIAELLARQLL